MKAARFGAWLAGVWAGVLAGVGFIGAPAGFAVATAEIAGKSAGRMFAQEAYLSLALAVVMFLIVRRGNRVAGKPVMSVEMLLTFGSLFCTVAGYFAVQPMMAEARAGNGALSFGALHGLSAGFYVLKTALVATLAWRLNGVSRSPSS